MSGIVFGSESHFYMIRRSFGNLRYIQFFNIPLFIFGILVFAVFMFFLVFFVHTFSRYAFQFFAHNDFITSVNCFPAF